jgi:hypothetical protein
MFCIGYYVVRWTPTRPALNLASAVLNSNARQPTTEDASIFNAGTDYSCDVLAEQEEQEEQKKNKKKKNMRACT